MSEDDMRALRDARLGARKIRRAALIAQINGWTLAVFAAMSLLGLFFSLSAIPIALAVGVIAWAELRGATLFKKLDLRACSWLMRNQIALSILIIFYAGWMLLGAIGAQHPSELNQALAGADPQMAAMIEDLTRTLTVAIYATLAIVGPVIPASTAWYYASRRKHLVTLFEDSPEWALDVLREAA